MPDQSQETLVTVRLRDGVEILLSDGTRVVCDAADPDGDVNVVSHAHSDHLPDGEATAVCSPLTAALATARRDAPLRRTTDDRVELRPAGHVAGSRAALVTDPDGTRYLYTGDVCTRSRFYLDGFEPVEADVLIVESTYGAPGYELPPTETVLRDALDWLAETDAPVLLFGYALGRAQKLQRLLARSDRDRVLTTDAVLRANEVIGDHLDVEFGAQRYDGDVTLDAGDAVVLPAQLSRFEWVERLREKSGAVAAGFSGWAVDSSYRYSRGYDAAFPLSDHCDFGELRGLVAAVDPERVYTQHGSTADLAERLTRDGYDATALRRNQLSLDDF